MNFACLSVCIDPINVKTSEPIKLNIFEATHVILPRILTHVILQRILTHVILNIYGYSELPKY